MEYVCCAKSNFVPFVGPTDALLGSGGGPEKSATGIRTIVSSGMLIVVNGTAQSNDATGMMKPDWLQALPLLGPSRLALFRKCLTSFVCVRSIGEFGDFLLGEGKNVLVRHVAHFPQGLLAGGDGLWRVLGEPV